MIGLFIGRFQPFHNGHLRAIKYALESCSKLIILVGSSQKCYEVQNPFTVGERVEMIFRTLDAEGLSGKCLILPISDIQNNGIWTRHVVATAPKFDVVYTNTPLPTRLFSDAGFKVKKIPFFSRDSLEGTKVRELMLKGKGWEKYVPKEVEKFIKEIDGVGRVQSLED